MIDKYECFHIMNRIAISWSVKWVLSTSYHVLCISPSVIGFVSKINIWNYMALTITYVVITLVDNIIMDHKICCRATIGHYII